MSTRVKVALDKEKHPERYCPEPRCLWKTAKLNHTTQQYEGGGPCPQHGGKRNPFTRAEMTAWRNKKMGKK